MEKRVLLIDDDPQFLECLQDALDSGVSLKVVSIADDVIAACADWRPHLILLDVLIAPGDPFRILDDISGHDNGTAAAVLCLSRGAGSTTHLRSFGDTVFGILKREIDRETLVATIQQALGSPSLAAA